MNVSVRLALAAAAVVIVAFAGFRFLTPNQQVAGPPTSPPSAAPSASPIPTVRPATPLGAGGTPANTGTYKTAFEPPLTLTISTVVNLDCKGSPCWGQISVNEPSWLDLGFGTTHGAELMVFALAQVPDPSSTGLRVPPAKSTDTAALIAASPKITVLAAPKSVTIGGLDATQIDVQAHEGFSLGTRPDVADAIGLATQHETRVIIVVVNGQTVAITEEIAADNTIHDFQAALLGLKPTLDSIKWE